MATNGDRNLAIDSAAFSPSDIVLLRYSVGAPADVFRTIGRQSRQWSGNDTLIWPHRDGLIWPRLRHAGLVVTV